MFFMTGKTGDRFADGEIGFKGASLSLSLSLSRRLVPISPHTSFSCPGTLSQTHEYCFFIASRDILLPLLLSHVSLMLSLLRYTPTHLTLHEGRHSPFVGILCGMANSVCFGLRVCVCVVGDQRLFCPFPFPHMSRHGKKTRRRFVPPGRRQRRQTRFGSSLLCIRRSNWFNYRCISLNCLG